MVYSAQSKWANKEKGSKLVFFLYIGLQSRLNCHYKKVCKYELWSVLRLWLVLQNSSQFSRFHFQFCSAPKLTFERPGKNFTFFSFEFSRKLLVVFKLLSIYRFLEKGKNRRWSPNGPPGAHRLTRTLQDQAYSQNRLPLSFFHAILQWQLTV